MFNKKQDTASPQFDNFDTLIGKKAEFEGTIKAQEPIRVDGCLTGEIVSESDVVIGEGSKVKGNIQCKNILLAGSVDGNVHASGQLHITGTGSLYGDASIYSFIVDENGIFDGGCQMKKSDQNKSDLTEPSSDNEQVPSSNNKRNNTRKSRS
ncbi:bactofilin family protein [Tindallia californiensis]|uniref:Protein CcmA, bactofilin family n=1 Tax=Tindallia californiensis TaxID=159292 RepID=A0A1H3IW92_9FIRM|nr:polymer-forming cytoskeletal protein [Tindallia californiensis]SDY31932.1 protein CcmA, bactofilin family [Tindallia californiensis]